MSACYLNSVKWGLCILAVLVPQFVHAIGNLSNPLIRPATYGQGLGKESQSEGSGSAPGSGNGLGNQSDGGQSSQSVKRSREEAGSADENLQGRAERRLTQEDLNIRQQQLNSSVIPLPLERLFENMHVVANFQGAVVLRKIVQKSFVDSGSGREPEGPSGALQGQASGQSQGRAAAPAAGVPVSIDSTVLGPNSVLRLNVGRIVSINGYKLRVTVNGQDVAVDWQDEKGRFVNVYVGAIQSGSGVNPVPPKSSLEAVQTQAFQYLKPQVGGGGLAGSVNAGGLGGLGQGGIGGAGGLSNGFGGQTGGGFGSSSGGFINSSGGFR